MLTGFIHARRSLVLRYGLAVVSVVVALCLEIVIQTAGSQYLFIAFAPAVAFSAWCGGVGPAVLAVALATACADFFSLGAGLDFHLDSRADFVVLGTFAGSWLIVSLLAGRVYERLEREGEERHAAERVAAQSDRLEQFTAALAAARTTPAAIEACVQEALFALHADVGLLAVVRDGARNAEIVRAVGYPPGVNEPGACVSLDERNPIAEAVRRRTCVTFESLPDRVAEYGEGSPGRATGQQAIAAVPLTAGGRPLAVLCLEYEKARRFNAEDQVFLQAIAPRAGQALDRTAQFEAAERARAEAERERQRADEELAERQRVALALRASETRYRALAARTARLHDLAAALSEAVTLRAVAEALVRHGRIVAGAAAASVALLVDGSSLLQTLCAENESGHLEGESEAVPLAEGSCATAAVERREPVFIAAFDDERQQRYWRSASNAADGGYVSSATLPLLVESSPIGVVSFEFAAPVNFDEEYRALLVSVAHHCAQALDRARLYEEAQRARTDAETANRTKDEFLSVVSHELRTPLNSIVGWASMLQKGQVEGKLSARALRAIRDNATRQAKLIDELLDFSRMVAGRMHLERHDIDLVQLVRGVVEAVLPVAVTKSIDLQIEQIAPAHVVGDPRRLEQVFLNLLGNALKFTPAGGRVRLGSERCGGAVEVTIADSGIGIPAAFLPHVFDRFRQADSSVTRNYGGLGLGLSIAKQLVEWHGGTIRVASEGPDRGAVFTVALPLAAASVHPAQGTGAALGPLPPDQLSATDGFEASAT